MEWIAENWFLSLIIILFADMHMFGHGHGGQSGRGKQGGNHGVCGGHGQKHDQGVSEENEYPGEDKNKSQFH